MKNIHKPIIGIMGPGNPEDPNIINHAELLGKKIAEQQWVLLTGGRNVGVMNAASKGAFQAGGSVMGILPGSTEEGMSKYVTLPVKTGMGSGRNVLNIITADVIVVCGMGAGTASEASLAIKHNCPLLFTMISQEDLQFFKSLSKHKVTYLDDIELLIQKIASLI